MEQEFEQNLQAKHKEEKEALAILESTVDYKINNPILLSQRDKVRRLKDKIIYLEESKTFVPGKYKCQFAHCADGEINPKCQKTINHTLKTWVLYGNCCRSCNKILNNEIEEELIY